MSINQSKDFFFTKLAFHQAEINLGSTNTNPSVGCIIVKNNSVISSGHTSFNGRPHAESNALKKKLNYENSDLYVTLEPCSHYGNTAPCINKIIRKKIKRVIFAVNDTDLRSKNKAHKKLKNKNISLKKFILKKFAEKFYASYFVKNLNKMPFVDAKLAVSKDYFTINKKDKYITNIKSRTLGNFLRSKYDCLLTTSKTINADDPLLDCRVEGLEKKTPNVIILDRFMKIKKNSKIFKQNKRKIFIVTNVKNFSKEVFLKSKGVKIIKLIKQTDESLNLKNMLMAIKGIGFNRILVESGNTFLNQLLKSNLIRNFYLFKSSKNIHSKGQNNSSILYIKKIKIFRKSRIKINLKGDSLFKINL
jgi:diaminohydroxyphosphoribosylaminopyrimidine deaminase/5-amino-6-(5-phosphoribosylamino)uracil reductase